MSNNNGSSKREFDLVLFGATGFTGKLVAEYLVKKRAPVRLALAGRSRDKLHQVRSELASIDAGRDSAADLPVLVGDSLDPAAVSAIVQKARAVATTVGPYHHYGKVLAAACAEHGTHYCDITGEALFIREVIDENHDKARSTGARIVHCCGFDSIPSDLGTFLVHDHFAQKGERLAVVHTRVRAMKGAASGGTLTTMLDIAERAASSEARRVLLDPYALNPRDAARGPDKLNRMGAHVDEDTGAWSAPFIMSAINGPIVRRSNALMGFPYGEDFHYDEAMETGKGIKGLTMAAGVSAGMMGFLALAGAPPTRALLRKLLPKPGSGPSREARESGYFRVYVYGTSDKGKKVKGVVEGTSDPGYGETAKMLGEAALCLASDNLSSSGGVLTPASAMGMTLIERLRAAGMTFRVDDM